MAMNYVEPAYDDDHCDCGAALPKESGGPDSWDFHGFCNMGCALMSLGGFTLTGKPAIEMAEHCSRSGGPGFEREPRTRLAQTRHSERSSHAQQGQRTSRLPELSRPLMVVASVVWWSLPIPAAHSARLLGNPP